MQRLWKNLQHISKVLSNPYGSFGVIPPEPDAALWRYMNLEKFEWLIRNSALFLCRSDRFDDQFEGALTKWSLMEASFFETLVSLDSPNGQHAHQEHWRVLLRQSTFVNCWFMNDYESDAMWRLYGGSADSVAVCTKAANLLKYFLPGRGYYVGKVFYIDYEKDGVPPFTTRIEPFFYKRHEYSHEKEVRIVAQEHGFRNSPVEQLEPGIMLFVDLHSLIESIVVAPRASKEFVKTIQELLKEVDIPPNIIRRSKLETLPQFSSR
jgi:hypothetical protein